MREKIVWSDAERAAITSRAVDLVAEQPKLTGCLCSVPPWRSCRSTGGAG